MKLSVPTLNRETSRLRTDGRLLLPDMTGSREDALWDREIMTCIVHVPRRTQLDTALPRTYYSAYRATSSFLPQLAIPGPASNSLCGTRFLSASALGRSEASRQRTRSRAPRLCALSPVRPPRVSSSCVYVKQFSEPPAWTVELLHRYRGLAQKRDLPP